MLIAGDYRDLPWGKKEGGAEEQRRRVAKGGQELFPLGHPV